MKIKKPLSATRKEYNRIRKNLRNRLYRARKKGIDTSNIKLPPIPKKITPGSIRKLEKKTKSAEKEIIKKKKRLKPTPKKPQTKKNQKKKGKTTKPDQSKGQGKTMPADVFSGMVIENFLNSLLIYSDRAQSIMKSWLNNLRAKRGDDAVAEMLEEGGSHGVIFTWEMSYDDNLRVEFISRMLEYLPDIGDMEKEDIIESVYDDVDNYDYDNGEKI